VRTEGVYIHHKENVGKETCLHEDRNGGKKDGEIAKCPIFSAEGKGNRCLGGHIRDSEWLPAERHEREGRDQLGGSSDQARIA